MTTEAQMLAIIAADLPTNGVGGITAETLRAVLNTFASGQIPTYGFPVGGSKGQIPYKNSTTDYDKVWGDPLVVTITDPKYGAVSGTNSAVTASTALSAALDDIIASADRNGTVIIPPGTFWLNTRVAKTLSAGRYRITIRGWGPSSRLVVNNATGGISFTASGAGANSQITLQDLTLEPGIDGAGLGFEVVNVVATNSLERKAQLINVNMVPQNSNTSVGAFNKAVRLYGVYRPFINNLVHFRGEMATTHMDYVVACNACYAPQCIHSYFNGDSDVNLLMETLTGEGAPEGLLVYDCVMSNGDIGLKVSKQVANAQPYGFVGFNNFNNEVTGIQIDGENFVVIRDNYIIISPPSSPATCQGIKVMSSSGMEIVDNFITNPGGPDHLTHIMLTEAGSVVGAPRTQNIHIGWNEYLGNTDVTPINIGASVDRVTVELPVYTPAAATLPAKLVTIDAAATNITVKRPLGDGSSNTTAVGNVGAGEDDLQTYTLPAGYILKPGKGVIIEASGTAANNANTKTLKLYFGSANILAVTLTTGSARTWSFRMLVVSTGSDAQDYYLLEATDGTTTVPSASATITTATKGTATQDEDSAIIIKTTGEATNNNDIVAESLVVRFLDT